MVEVKLKIERRKHDSEVPQPCFFKGLSQPNKSLGGLYAGQLRGIIIALRIQIQNRASSVRPREDHLIGLDERIFQVPPAQRRFFFNQLVPDPAILERKQAAQNAVKVSFL